MVFLPTSYHAFLFLHYFFIFTLIFFFVISGFFLHLHFFSQHHYVYCFVIIFIHIIFSLLFSILSLLLHSFYAVLIYALLFFIYSKSCLHYFLTYIFSPSLYHLRIFSSHGGLPQPLRRLIVSAGVSVPISWVSLSVWRNHLRCFYKGFIFKTSVICLPYIFFFIFGSLFSF